MESVCVSHAWCMYVPYLSPTNTLHCTDYHPCLVPRAFFTIPILHILQFKEFFHLLVYIEVFVKWYVYMQYNNNISLTADDSLPVLKMNKNFVVSQEPHVLETPTKKALSSEHERRSSDEATPPSGNYQWKYQHLLGGLECAEKTAVKMEPNKAFGYGGILTHTHTLHA